MADKLSCPYCATLSFRLMEAMVTIRFIERSEDGPARERKCAVYRCLACGQTFDEMEAGDGPMADAG